MALRIVLQEPDERLRKKSREVKEITPRILQLLDDMAETMKTYDGVGLAAPQVGVLRRVVVIDVGQGLVELINPVITSFEGENRDEEGCLSCEGRRGYVVRPQKVTAKALNREGKEVTYEAEGLFARAICHECDHLDGKLFIDIMDEEIFYDEDEDIDE